MGLRTIIGCLLFTLLKVCICDMPSGFVSEQHRLVKALFANYDKSIRPVKDWRSGTNVTLNPGLFSIINTDEAQESITIAQTFRMAWKDEFLSWNPDDYGGIKQLLHPLIDLWYPDIAYLNMIDLNVITTDDRNYASIGYDGSVITTILEEVIFHCKYYIHMFPFDIQNCTMSASSWMYTANVMDIFYSTPIDLDFYVNSTEWDLISLTARRVEIHYNTTGNTWVTIYYDLVIQRKPAYYLFTFVVPCMIINLVSIVGIFAPFNDVGDREEKVSMALTTQLTMAVILTIITDKMPRTSEGIPFLALYIMVQVIVSASNAFISATIMYHQRKWIFGEQVPRWLLFITCTKHRKVGVERVTGKPITSSHTIGTEVHVTSDQSPLSGHLNQQLTSLYDIRTLLRQVIDRLYDQEVEDCLRKEWQRVAFRLDLIFMCAFLALNVTFTLSFIIVGYSSLKI